jgi:hypothetical protein
MKSRMAAVGAGVVSLALTFMASPVLGTGWRFHIHH